MLIIKKPIDKGSVVTFRLVNGETLIAKFVEQTATHLTVTKPVVANPINNEQGFGIFYTPFAATVDEESDYRIPLASILMEPMPPRDELRASYVKMTTGLAIPQ